MWTVRWPHEKIVHPYLSTMWSVKILIRLHERSVWSDSSLSIHVRRYVSWLSLKCQPSSSWNKLYMSQRITKPTKWHVHPAKTQIRLGICSVWSESSLCAQWVAKDPSFLYADSKDSNQTTDAQADLSLCWAQMPFCRFCYALAHMAFTLIIQKDWCKQIMQIPIIIWNLIRIYTVCQQY